MSSPPSGMQWWRLLGYLTRAGTWWNLSAFSSSLSCCICFCSSACFFPHSRICTSRFSSVFF